MCKCFNSAGSSSAGKSRWEKAVELSPNDIGLLHQLAQSELELGNFGAAVDAYRKALISEPEHLELWCNLGSVLKRAKQLPDSMDAWRKALSFNGENAVAWAGLGATQLELELYPEARRSLERAVQLNPDAREPQANLILVALGESSFSEAESRFLEQPESWQQDPAGLEIHGAILDGWGPRRYSPEISTKPSL